MANIQRARRIPNANGQVLIENWVEERATEHIDHRIQPVDQSGQPSQSLSPPKTKKTSHTALLTHHYTSPLDKITTYHDAYDEFGPFAHKEQGARRKRLEHALTRQVASEFNARQREFEENLRQERINDSTSEYRVQFTKEFQSKAPPATQVKTSAMLFRSLTMLLLESREVAFGRCYCLFSPSGKRQWLWRKRAWEHFTSMVNYCSMSSLFSSPMTFLEKCRCRSGRNIDTPLT